MRGREEQLSTGRYDGLPGASMLDALASLPPLANADDRRQVEGIQVLVTQLQRLARQTAPEIGTQGLPPQVSSTPVCPLLRMSVSTGRISSKRTTRS